MRRRSLLAAVPAAVLAAGCSSRADARPPADAADYATERLSAQGHYRVSWRPQDGGPVPVHRLHAWVLHVARPDGSPVTGAAINVDGDMPEHRHGLPTRPRMTRELGAGDYLVEGVKFQMGGWWVMDFDIAAAGQADRVRFNLQLKK